MNGRKRVHTPLEVLEKNLQELSEIARQTMNVLATPGRHSVSERYRITIAKVGEVERRWVRHIRLLREAEGLDRTVDKDEVLESQLASIVRAPWPRSPLAAMPSLRHRVVSVLTELLRQVERERRITLPRVRQKLAEDERQSSELNVVSSELTRH